MSLPVPIALDPAEYEISLARRLTQALSTAPKRILLETGEEDLSVDDLARQAAGIALFLERRGVAAGDRVAVMMDNHPVHLATLIGLALIGAIWVPVNPKLKAASIRPILEGTEPVGTLVDPHHIEALAAAGATGWRTTTPALALMQAAFPSDRIMPGPDDVRAILFTSGTTGPSKGVIVTERMFAAAGLFAGLASAVGPTSRFLLWEPLCHIGGAQLLPMALWSGATLCMVPRFSASRFWDQARAFGVNRIHYLGGIIDMLLRQPPSGKDRNHDIELGFGAGASIEAAAAFEDRFGVPLIEVYGQTEASSFTTINLERHPGSIGRSVPGFDVAILDGGGHPANDGELGEIVILNADPPGLLTPGYWRNDAATHSLRRDGRLHTGDLGRVDKEGRFQFVGRVKEAIRCRGENVSAWEVEQALLAHPAVQAAAVIGIKAEIGEEEILAVLEPATEERPGWPSLLAFAEERLASFQLPPVLALAGGTATHTDRTNRQAGDFPGRRGLLGPK